MSSANRDLVTMNRDFVRLKRDFRIQEIAPLLSLCFIIIVLTGLSAFIKKRNGTLMTRIEQMHTVFFSCQSTNCHLWSSVLSASWVCHSDFGTPHHPSLRRMYVREGGGVSVNFYPASFNPVASGDGVVQRGDAQARVHAVAFASQEVVGGEDAFIAYEVSADGDVGQRGSAVQ